MKIAFGNDHAGYPLKADVLNVLKEAGVEVIDYGCQSTEPVDFPDIARRVCDDVRSGACDRGIMLCGTGVGASIAANKIQGIRASVCHDIYSAHQCVEHDDVNVMCIGAQIIGSRVAKEMIETFLKAEFSTEEHFRRRVRKLRDIEEQSAMEIMKQKEA
ncbi:ribose 5-phosphate isomerase B [Marinicrinis sediminis]|uniref:Ribose 5-phosphate isomerase B n=1 Tax=Marinicrinis sediminis TaxID=1652465 RepID=A0ABW5RAC1_9BACL